MKKINYEQYVVTAPEAAHALAEGRPVVALESTIISHGMPYPENLQTAEALEKIVRDEGAVPATIAVIDGKIRIGLGPREMEILAGPQEVLKASRKDLPVVLAKGLHAATTVAGTMFCAALAGIQTFATGGIGGVHRGGEKNLDISADLNELAVTKTAVVCAGAKAVLDLPLTLEYLETAGVPVIGYQTRELPAFYTRESGLTLDFSLNTPEEVAETMRIKWGLGLTGGIVIANPIPPEAALEKEFITIAIEQALKKAEEMNIKGKEVTPFLLDALKEATGGKSLTANIALVKNNARLAARIARAFADSDTGQNKQPLPQE